MYARIARFEGGDTSQLEAVIDGSRETTSTRPSTPRRRAWRSKGGADARRSRERQRLE